MLKLIIFDLIYPSLLPSLKNLVVVVLVAFSAQHMDSLLYVTLYGARICSSSMTRYHGGRMWWLFHQFLPADVADLLDDVTFW